MQSRAGGIDLNKALNDLIQAGIRDPNILLKYSQNPPPEYGANGSMLVSLAANAVARDKEAVKSMQPSPNTTIAEQIQTKLASAAQPQGIAGLAPRASTAPQGINTPPPPQNMDAGVANLPINDAMYSDQNYAGGGIVSFVKGGSSDDSYSDMYSDDLDRAMAIKQYELNKNKSLQDKTYPGFLSTMPTNPEQYDTNYLASKVGPGGYDRTLESPVLSTSNLETRVPAVVSEKNPFDTYKNAASSSPGIGGLNTANTQPKTLNAMIDDRKKLLESQGVDTSYFDKQLTELRKEKEEDLTSSQRMMQSNILFSLAKSLGETPGGLIRGLVKGGIDAGPVVDAAMKEQKEIKKLSNKEERATTALQRAEKRGDVDAIEKAKSNRETIEAELQGKHITGGYGIKVANIAAESRISDKTVANREKIAQDIRERIKQTHAQGDLTDEQYNTMFNKMYYDALKLNNLLPEGTVVPASSSGKGKTVFSTDAGLTTGVYHP
jgi:hypothetical protein